MTWPPVDTDRNRLLFAAGAVVGALAAVYFLLWALQTRGLVPWAGFTVLLAATLLAGTALLLMREQRRRPAPEPAEASEASGVAEAADSPQP